MVCSARDRADRQTEDLSAQGGGLGLAEMWATGEGSGSGRGVAFDVQDRYIASNRIAPSPIALCQQQTCIPASSCCPIHPPAWSHAGRPHVEKQNSPSLT